MTYRLEPGAVLSPAWHRAVPAGEPGAVPSLPGSLAPCRAGQGTWRRAVPAREPGIA
ncbi:MAG TPA: hypothetical protein VN840_04680 [Streptosporangiaceae bacterium]|nr:hypothetical protein [Streptosporangiaceae bacterium]